MKVLIADDDRVTRLIVRKKVESWGYQAVLAENGKEALETLLGEDPPRIAILDWMMPEMDGVDVCAALAAETTELTVYTILLTSKSEKADMVKAFQNGAHDFIGKPPDPDELRCRIDVGRRLVETEDKLRDFAILMEQQARTDPLTGISNRRNFFEIGNRDLYRAIRNQAPLAVVMMDIDHFKKVNDTHGHNVGDKVLVQLAEIIGPVLRTTDVFARVGGEEFALLVNDADEQNTLGLAERIRISIAEAEFPSSGAEPVKVTMSMGISSFWPADRELEDILKRADLALYQAKAAGRNQSIIFSG